MLEKSKDAWDKFQSVTAPMESQPLEAGPVHTGTRDREPPVERRICMCLCIEDKGRRDGTGRGEGFWCLILTMLLRWV